MSKAYYQQKSVIYKGESNEAKNFENDMTIFLANQMAYNRLSSKGVSKQLLASCLSMLFKFNISLG